MNANTKANLIHRLHGFRLGLSRRSKTVAYKVSVFAKVIMAFAAAGLASGFIIGQLARAFADAPAGTVVFMTFFAGLSAVFAALLLMLVGCFIAGRKDVVATCEIIVYGTDSGVRRFWSED